jgi:hypothetical protein
MEGGVGILMEIEGVITTSHAHPAETGGAIRPDNLSSMTTMVEPGHIKTVIRSLNLRSVIASVDDYLMNLGLAEEICSYALH